MSSRKSRSSNNKCVNLMQLFIFIVAVFSLFVVLNKVIRLNVMCICASPGLLHAYVSLEHKKPHLNILSYHQMLKTEFLLCRQTSFLWKSSNRHLKSIFSFRSNEFFLLNNNGYLQNPITFNLISWFEEKFIFDLILFHQIYNAVLTGYRQLDLP